MSQPWIVNAQRTRGGGNIVWSLRMNLSTQRIFGNSEKSIAVYFVMWDPTFFSGGLAVGNCSNYEGNKLLPLFHFLFSSLEEYFKKIKAKEKLSTHAYQKQNNQSIRRNKITMFETIRILRIVFRCCKWDQKQCLDINSQALLYSFSDIFGYALTGIWIGNHFYKK